MTPSGSQWVVRVCPVGGWRPANRGGLLAGVVAVAVALALLLFAALVSRRQLTPADLILNMLARLLEGCMPDLRDVVFIRQAIIRGADLYQPVDLRKHIRSANLDNEVARALMQQLGNTTVATSTYDSSTHLYGGESDYTQLRVAASSLTSKGLSPAQPQQQLHGQAQQDCSTLAGALAFILTPQPVALTAAPAVAVSAVRRLEPVESLSGDPIGSEALFLPPRETEAGSIASPRLSMLGGMVRAVSLLRDGGGGGGSGSAGPAAAAAIPPILAAAGSGGGMGVGVGSCRLGASMELVQEEDEQLCRFQRQQRHHHHHQLQRQTPGGSVRRSSLALREQVRRFSRDDDVGDVELPPPPLAHSDLDVAAAAIAAAGGTPGASGGGGGGGGGESDGRLTPNSATSMTQEDSTLGIGTFSVVRRLPRRVASAMNILSRPGSSRQRRCSLLTAANGCTQTDVAALERRLALIVSAAAAPPPTPAAAAAAAAVARRASVASVASVPEVLVSDCPRSEGLPVVARRSGTGLEVGGNRAMFTLPCGGAAVNGRRSHLGSGPCRASALLRASSVPPPPPLIEEVERFLSNACAWQFDTWRLRDITHGHPLSALGFYLIQRAGLIAHFSLNPVKVARLLRHIEAGYNDNPYHNATHAADVLQTLHVIIHGAQLHVHYLDQLGLLAAYFAAIVHDYGHPGLTNDFLVATSDPLAVRYNDKSPLENHHAAAAFSCMRRTGLDVLAPLTTDQKSTFRKQVIEMVLATDMKQHFSLLSHFSTVHRLASYNKPAAVAGGPPPSGSVGATSADCKASLELPAVSIASPSMLDMAPKPLDETERLLSLQMVIKAADLGHLGEGFEVHKRWLSSLEEEFFRQGDKERQLGIPISPLFDRAKQGVSKSQVGFYDFVALPLLHALCSAFPGTQPLMTCFMDNYHHYTADSHALAES
ncbi:3'5'-cyclic nucleotide phosphodiesterase [Volvox carteri f. nagariensis]|uniref:Phosphodiesterase n=1 Tax=Volvox carteri f. nagariensis TaxID=3068 RepID=D8TVU5_VOLCA|nr:3'5'-cyclic nucleotide phosphodiesterase [Volvox carteri f. nagariensis]EFJ48257.1 3'5'-cyclic nucleotide phosphodiesterase [Volvox carteri f. nagariensis]|eukprot:XP_002950511.1 3'5'-cyclic nucleotide phosphodiesterase [Volvox carteri f. nagariensis]